MTHDTPNDRALAPLIADLYAEVAPPLRVRLLRGLLRPVGPLALVAIAAGAFARLLPSSRWNGADVGLEDALRIGPEQVFELARYVEQKSPELLLQLPDLLGDRPVLAGTLSGSLLLLALHAMALRRWAEPR
jgi:hypothetical protein